MIRPYRAQDLDRVVAIWYAASRAATPFLSEEFLAREEGEIRNVWMSQAEAWVYEAKGGVAGFIALLDGEVGGIFVHPRAQRTGIGRALMDHAAALKGRLVLNVFEANAVGRAFYDRYGFREIGQSVHADTGQIELRLEYVPAAGTGAP